MHFQLVSPPPPAHWATREHALFHRIWGPHIKETVEILRCYKQLPWYDLNTQGKGDDLQLFWRECSSLYIHLHARNTPHSYYTHTGGGEDFLYTDLQVWWCIGTTLLTAIPGWTYLPITPTCNAFACNSSNKQDLLRHVQHHGQPIFFCPRGLTNVECEQWMAFFDKAVSVPPAQTPLRLYVLVNRQHSRSINAWLDTYEQRGICHTLSG